MNVDISDKMLVSDCLADAKTAMNNGKIDLAKKHLMIAYDKEPENLDVLKMLGGACALLGEFEDSLKFYSENAKLDDSGDSYYLLGNTYFLMAQYNNAFGAYVAAESKGCSKEIMSKVYYQLALICSIKGDRQAALINMQKYEDTDPTGLVALDEDFLSEKVKIYIQEGDSDNALVYAERLLRIKPQQFSYYGLVFNLRMAAAKYKEAAAVLEDAGKLPLSYEQRTALTTEKISMYIELSNVYPESEAQYYSEALRLIGEIEKDKELTQTNKNEFLLMKAEIYLKAGNIDRALMNANEIIAGKNIQNVPSPEEIDKEYHDKLENPKFIASIGTNDIYNSKTEDESKKIRNSEETLKKLTDNLESNVEIKNNDLIYDSSADEEKLKNLIEQVSKDDAEKRLLPFQEFSDRLNNVFVSCYIDKENYEDAYKLSKILKNSEDNKYSNFGYYVEVFAARKLLNDNKIEKSVVDDLYDKAIAHFKKLMFENPSDKTAAIFRTRLYAENGKFALAEQCASVLDDAVMESLIKYIAECRDSVLK